MKITRMATIKLLDLFGAAVDFPQHTNAYDAFVEKFTKPREKTTDDCYTPEPVYNTVLEWLGEQVDLAGREIVRPFWPDTDYKTFYYPEGCVVVDNPPFSILSQIVTYYVANNIAFFLFAPGKTLFTKRPITHVVVNTNVTFENKAAINIGFLSSLFGNTRVWLCGELRRRLRLLEPRRVKENRTTSYAYHGGEIVKIYRRRNRTQALHRRRPPLSESVVKYRSMEWLSEYHKKKRPCSVRTMKEFAKKNFIPK